MIASITMNKATMHPTKIIISASYSFGFGDSSSYKNREIYNHTNCPWHLFILSFNHSWINSFVHSIYIDIWLTIALKKEKWSHSQLSMPSSPLFIVVQPIVDHCEISKIIILSFILFYLHVLYIIIAVYDNYNKLQWSFPYLHPRKHTEGFQILQIH